ncbi:uncharacterized protein LOC100906143 [Galendromus occidentalis]|uniref:Uncharacterized protein LOC100906143 n=1 Tax=Galendromus occidentalis TaxID=34638 RepID=A0AAJ6QMH7_9ACAR|nr:uncharacterized protein LOC100906143 [Galendromus occidentalis]
MAPLQLDAIFGVKKSGSVANTLSLETEMEIRSPDETINMGLTSSAKISLWQRSNKVDIETTVNSSGRTSTIVFKNVLDATSWSIDWRYRGARQPEQRILSSGTYNLELPKLHLRGVFEMDMRPLGERFVIEPVALNSELMLHQNEIGFLTELSENTKDTILRVAAKAINERAHKQLDLDLNIRGKPYHGRIQIDGQDLGSGWSLNVDTRNGDKSFGARGGLRLEGNSFSANVDLESSYPEFSNAKLLLQSQNVKPGSLLLNAEYALGKHFMKAEATATSRLLEADVRSSFEDWKNVKLSAAWKLEPKINVVVNFSTVKMANNVLDVEVDPRDGLTARARVTVPTMYNGNLLEGNFRFSNGKGRLDVLHRGVQKARLVFDVKNDGVFKSLASVLSYDIDGVSDRWNFDFGLENDARKVYDAKVKLAKNSNLIFEVSYLGALSLENGVLLKNRMEVQTVIPGFWRRAYVLNEVVANSENLRSRHEMGKSAKDVQYSIDVSGKLVNERDSFALEGKLDGRWERSLRGSVSGELKSDKKNTIAFESRVESNRAPVCSSKLTLARRRRLVELEASWEAPRMTQGMLLNMRSGIEDNDAFVFDTKLERDQAAEKTTELSVRVPLQLRNIDGHLKIKMPEEFGGQALALNLMAKNSMFNVDAGVSMDGGRHQMSGQLAASWDRDFTLNGMLRRNGDNIAKAILKASWRRPEAYEGSAEIMHNGVSYKANIDGSWTPESGDISLGAESSQWSRRHTLRGGYSMASKSGNMKIDIANLKMNIDSMMSGPYTVRGNAQYRGEQVGEMDLVFNPNSKQGNLDATVRGRRVSSNFIAKLDQGQIKMEFPSGSSGLTWSLNQAERMSIDGHWTFRDDKWRLEIFLDPHNAREAAALVYFKEKRVGAIEALWRPNDMVFNIAFEHQNEQHAFKIGFKKPENSFRGFFNLNCFWIHPERIESELNAEYGGSKLAVNSKLQVGSRVYSVAIDGNIQGERINGSIQYTCPTHGKMSAQFEGALVRKGLYNGFKAKLVSDKLQKPLEIEGFVAENGVMFALKTEGHDSRFTVYMGNKPNFELTEKAGSQSETRQQSTGNAPPTYGVEAEWFGKKVLALKLTGKNEHMLSGVFAGNFDFGESSGKHEMIVTYSLENVRSFKVEFDGETILEARIQTGNDHLVDLKWNMKFARAGDLALSFKHQLDRQTWTNKLELSQNGKKLGFAMRLNKDIHGSMLRVDTPRRSVMMELDSKKPSADGSFAGRLAWDHDRDPQKVIEVMLSGESNNKGQGARRERLLIVSVPTIGEKMIVRLNETDGEHQIQMLDEKNSMHSPRMSLVYSKQGKLKMVLGNLMMQAEMSPKKSELILRRASSHEDDINIGYAIQRNTLSARLNWTPRLMADYESAAKNMLKELQKNPDNKQNRQWKKISEFVASESRAFSEDIKPMITDLKRLYEQNALHLKTVSESMVRAGEHVSSYARSVSDQTDEIIRDLKRTVARYNQRLVVASSVIEAIRQEIVEDIVLAIERWFNRVEKSISNENMRKLVHSVIEFLKEEYEVIVGALDYAVDKYICEFSSEESQLNNKRCGFAYELNSQNQQQGLAMRVPMLAMKS